MTSNTTEYAPQNYNEQFEEEQRKYHLYNKSDEWKNAIQETEDTPCLEGRILFLLDYANDDLDTFKKCSGNAIALLKANYNMFERLLMNDSSSSYPCQLDDMVVSKLIKGNFHIERIEQLTFSNKGKGDRDFGWHRLLNDNPDNYSDPRKTSLQKCQEACKELIIGDLQLKKTLSPNKDVEEWKKLLIDCPALIKYCTGTIIYKVTYNNDEEEKVIYYLSKGNLNKLFGKKNKISELYTRYVYEKLGGNDSGWEYVEWTYNEDCNFIDAYLKKGDVKVKHSTQGWETENLTEDLNSKTIAEIINILKATTFFS